MNLLNEPKEESFDDEEIIETKPVKQYIASLKDSLIVLGLVAFLGIEIGYAIFLFVNKNTVTSNFFVAGQIVFGISLVYMALRAIGVTDLIVKKISKRRNGTLTLKEQK